MASKIFLDTSYAIALSVESDSNHQRALSIAASLEAGQAHLITTRGILLEIGNSLSRHRYRNAAIRLLTALDSDPTIEVVGITYDLYTRGFELFQHRSDKDWGIIDCISFILMQERGVSKALTADVHFEQAGFIALLRG